MKTIKSLFLGSLLTVASLHAYQAKSLPSSHVALRASSSDKLESMTWKQLKQACSLAKIKGRSRLTTKAKMLKALRAI
jgi:hypothetical protein